MSAFQDNLRLIQTRAEAEDAVVAAAAAQRLRDAEEAERRAAQPIIDAIQAGAERAAAEKKSRYNVMSLFSGKDYDSSISTVATTTLSSWHLRPKARAVYDYLTKELGVEPKFAFDYSDGGENAWFVMYIDW